MSFNNLNFEQISNLLANDHLSVNNLENLTDQQVIALNKKGFLCPFGCNVKMLICKRNNKRHLRTFRNEINEHNVNCKFNKPNNEKYPSLNKAISQNINSEIYKDLLQFNSNDSKQNNKFKNIADLNLDSELGRNYFYGKIEDKLSLNNTMYIKLVPNTIKYNNINNTIYVDLMFNSKFFKNTNINPTEFNTFFDELFSKNINECVCYGVLKSKQSALGFNINILNALDFLIDGKSLKELIAKI